jgi:eukaryotic-like serine/threonine-protein kinase
MAHLFVLLFAPLFLAGLRLMGARRDDRRDDRRDNRRHPASAEREPAAPQRLGPYTLDRKIGAGAMGEVYRAWNSAVGAWHAIKLLPQHASPSERRRFEKEARLGALVRHPNSVSIIELAEERHGTCYYAMELLEGTSLQALVEREGPQPPARVARILAQLAAALQELHAQGLVHRDIKPDNVLLTGPDADVCKLIDFGLVEHVGALAEGQPEDTLIGTPLYISPEAILAPKTVGPHSDLYGLGAVGYFLLRGEPMFLAGSLIEVCCHHVHSTPEPLPLAPGDAAAAELERIVLDCLAKRPGDRPATAAEVARRVARCSAALGAPSLRAVGGRSRQPAEGCPPARAGRLVEHGRPCPIAA